ncbi:hypothetical protein HPB51_019216 [Rhipicephalus microplus]|uniref:Uncharacterized protein n=1 Tax=Rhipicephalus microplus TaxID=6941 RepID=A0A9J6DAZ6_RHIMP|nr:hypothetical protein HPB51_019216 [Rhipicephalus microplus]
MLLAARPSLHTSWSLILGADVERYDGTTGVVWDITPEHVLQTKKFFPSLRRMEVTLPMIFFPKVSLGLEVVTRAEQRLINARLHEINASLRKKELDLFFAKHQLEHRIPELMSEVKAFAGSVAASTTKKHRTTQDRKLSYLFHRSSTQSIQNSRFVTNLSSRPLTERETSVLAKGHVYNMSRTPRLPKLVAAVEKAV